MRIKKGDTVLIISGKDRGKHGKVLIAFPKDEMVLVEGINLRKKHQKPKRSGEKGQIVNMEKPISGSNVQLICPKCNLPARIGQRMEQDKKFRVCKKCGAEI